jgi:hypothetical protein
MEAKFHDQVSLQIGTVFLEHSIGKGERCDGGPNIESWQFLLNRRFQWRQIFNLINAFDRAGA